MLTNKKLLKLGLNYFRTLHQSSAFSTSIAKGLSPEIGLRSQAVFDVNIYDIFLLLFFF